MSETKTTEAPRARPDWFNLIAQERGMPYGWLWFKAEWRGDEVSGVFLITGGVTGELFKRGKFKGKPNPKLRTDVRELVVTRDEVKAIKAKWSAETGLCATCHGERRTVVTARSNGDHAYRMCRDCNGTGAALRAAAEGQA